IEEEFRKRVPSWVVDTETRELWKAELKAAGDLVSVRTIEQYENDHEEALRRERAERPAETAAPSIESPAQPQQPHPDLLEAERARLAAREQEFVKAAIEGRLPRGIGVARLCHAPAEWSRQYRMLGLTRPQAACTSAKGTEWQARGARAHSKIDRAIRGVTPALSACRRPLHRRLSESEKPTVSPQRSPETRE